MGDSLEMICLSIGENCATDMILQRFNIKSYSTPYSFARSNCFYALQLEKHNYDFLLDKKYLIKDQNSMFSNCYRNINFEKPEEGLFESSCANGFEFSHHDIVNKISDLESMKRKISRLNNLKLSNDDILFFYHHRYCDNCSIQNVIDYLNNFCAFYIHGNRQVNVVLLEQRIVSKPIERHVFISKHKNVILAYFYTERIWSGRDKNVLFAKYDDDLLFHMFYKLSYEYNLLPKDVILNKIKSDIQYQ